MKADIIIQSDAVFTGLKDQPERLAIAIKENKIINIDTPETMKKHAGDGTRIIDAGDKLVMPGFFDSHIHIMAGSLFNFYAVPLSEAVSAEDAGEKVKAYANEHPDAPWIVGVGWDHTAWGDKDFPDRYVLDRFVPDRPVFLIQAEGHYGWVNSKAIETAGITKDTENPDYGIVYKDENGEPTGILIESAMSLVGKYAYDFSEEQRRDMVQLFLDHAASLGVTSVNDLYLSRAHEQLEGYSVFKEFDEKDELNVRIHLYPPLNGDLEKAKEFKETFTSPKLKMAGLKQFIDGVVTGYTAYMLDPYKDKPETRGEIGFPEEQLQEWVTAADKEGYQIKFHTIGDGAVRLGLDLYKNAQKANGKRDSRHTLEHIEIVSPQDIPRFKELGVMPSVQPYHMALMPRESHTERVDEEKFPYLYPNATFFNEGNVMPYSSDYPIIPLNPMLGLYHAVTRKDYTLEDTWNEQEKISLSQALKAYTYGSAYSVFRESEIGTLEEGKLADIVILDRNLFDVPEKEILDTKAELTIVDGKVVYEKPAQAAAL
ncbi:amidohydrolase family protein [Siminovitchia fortis]|uniref:Amidohydrolase n=1 Tax=Siminovitchia fortis TaxID=254758 RepID=A0A443ISV6_9BACI|nr:amidohydrolase [Siminovitchia fortis]RWR10063.1 amidohydrolase [Siminovitchia fortis]WHY80721.1 amidohydrolase family protein [Siminovitchia fortis]